jgi:hypothetical protein
MLSIEYMSHYFDKAERKIFCVIEGRKNRDRRTAQIESDKVQRLLWHLMAWKYTGRESNLRSHSRYVPESPRS